MICEVADLNSARGSLGGCGGSSGQTASLATGGVTPPGSTRTAVNESWNGTSWTEIANTNNAQGYGGAAGQSNQNALKFGGSGGPTGFSAFTELFTDKN